MKPATKTLIEPPHKYIGPATVRLAFIPDSKFNGRKVRIVRWSKKAFRCFVRVGCRTIPMHPRCLLVQA